MRTNARVMNMNELAAPDFPIESERLTPAHWLRHDLTETAGTHRAERLDCEPGFSLVRSRISTDGAYSETCQHEGKERVLVIAFGLHGQSEFRDRKGERLPFAANRTTISIFREGEGTRSYAANHLVHQLRLVVAESALLRYIGEERTYRLLGTPLGMHESFRLVTFDETHASQHLCHLKKPDISRQDYLSQHIHALSLLSEQLQRLAPPALTHERMSSKDIDKLEQIEAYMRANLDKPLSNTLLCVLFGVSEYRLKECFRQAYGTSPNQHLQEMRMHRAREMLATGHQVAETAYRFGYQHPNNLSAAFIRFFGCTPKSVQGKRR